MDWRDIIALVGLAVSTIFDVVSTAAVRRADAVNPAFEVHEWPGGRAYEGSRGLVVRSIVGALAAVAVILPAVEPRFWGHGWLWAVALGWSAAVLLIAVPNNWRNYTKLSARPLVGKVEAGGEPR